MNGEQARIGQRQVMVLPQVPNTTGWIRPMPYGFNVDFTDSEHTTIAFK